MTSIDTFVQITTTSKPDKRVSKRRGFGATVRSFLMASHSPGWCWQQFWRGPFCPGCSLHTIRCKAYRAGN